MTLPAKRILLGLEIADSGTRLAACIPAVADARRWHSRLSTPPTPADCIAALASLAGEVLRDTGVERVSAVGVAAWGHVDAVRGVISHLGATASWDGYPLRVALAASIGAPVAVASATEAGALAEAERFGTSPGQRVLYVSNARTITSALVVDGAIEGVEGQIGHLRVRDEGPRCSCGLHGHLEPIASAQSIVRTMIGRASDSDESHAVMQRISGGRAEAMTASQVVALAEQGDPIAAAVVGEALDALAVALADVVAVAAPSVVILGGPLVEAGEGFIGQLRERVVALVAPFAPPPALRWGALEPFAALLGAARVAEFA